MQITPQPIAQAHNELSQASDPVIRFTDFSWTRESLRGQVHSSTPGPLISSTTNPLHHSSTHKRADAAAGKGESLRKRVRFALLCSHPSRDSLGAAEVAAIHNTPAQLIKLIVKHFADPKRHINAK